MRAALAIHPVTGSLAENLAAIEDLAAEAASAGAELVVFGEAALTGLINNDDPEHDLALGQPIPGPVTDRLGALARQRSIHLALGMLEREGHCLYDSAILLGPQGDIALKYRRIQPQWHGRDADPEVYRQGDAVVAASTPLGSLAALLCGDLFDDGIVARVRKLAPDYLLFPFARSFSDAGFEQERWDREEESEYAARAAAAGCTTLMANILEAPGLTEWPSFGGAMVVSASGDILARWPLGTPGVLYAEV